MQIPLADLGDIDAVAQEIIRYAGNETIWLFDGEMGAGKTTLIKAICKQLGIVDETSSPTFALVNVYADAQGEDFYHFDFYRIESEVEAVDIGADEYFYSGRPCFIEWSEKIPTLIPSKNLKISINLDAERNRIVSLSKHE
ncbi:tRNA (adenosine(37)-N6)-threonylcarbamoyltransferase complex ATPase subunit type 1 TsaE [Reichenbachiella carrageenanivorans]|uniref:tRNA threonylcarbamoyladenosine biosynthesis protein TsaE n=1 Tax=Reichenbachiella carrageenanivorans TaxID=2979869 RepID=A0ABY6D1U3_9BACT|nr:tRNA (adenosine(37)-N6)-threonylcarbamoyltransferase complex ATPase subunit type 1 TsaE [Reichenbachiella carrageenanivorans]UXX79575.1 tRNA (adenosine(37)-N6)-threonylcarbamoyltransferase complex ATPase subunit type 1 TsaE [Reichenbachiella carrageenanivorans]